MSKRSITVLFAILTLGLLLTGCSSLPIPGAARDAAQDAVCQALDPLETVAGQLGEISADASVADVKALISKLDGPVQALWGAAGTLNITALDELFVSYDKLIGLVNELPEDATLDQAAAEVQAAVTEVQSALEMAGSALNCGQ